MRSAPGQDLPDGATPGHKAGAVARRTQGRYAVSVCSDPTSIPAAQWDALLAGDPDANPFLQHAFFSALHESGAAVAQTGWQPCFLLLHAIAGGPQEPAQPLAAAVPLYAKSHSYGEYVFDWAWASASERAGIPYYPKWLVAVPFTPVAGSRILARDADARTAAVDALCDFTKGSGLPSLHVLLAPQDGIDTLARHGLLVRQDVQFHWCNRGFDHFGQYLEALSQAKRKKVRAERRKVVEAGVRFERLVGEDIPEGDWDFFHACYANTYAEHGSHAYLDRGFFALLAQRMPANLLLVLAHREGKRIAAALGVVDRERGRLYGRYWGAAEPVDCLHFECCYYQMIEFAIEQGLAVFEGGAQGAHKLARGFDPVAVRSAHWLRDPGLRNAVARHLEMEGEARRQELCELDAHGAWKPQAPGAFSLGEDCASKDPESDLVGAARAVPPAPETAGALAQVLPHALELLVQSGSKVP